MEKDTHITDVQFLLEKDSINEVFAYFPKEKYAPEEFDGHFRWEKMFTCYCHVAQHSVCSSDYASECTPATAEQYKDLKAELEGLGYNLNIL